MLVKIWNLEVGDFSENLRGHDSAITCVDLAGDEAFAVSGSEDKTVKIWSVIMGCVITDYKVGHLTYLINRRPKIGDCFDLLDFVF